MRLLIFNLWDCSRCSHIARRACSHGDLRPPPQRQFCIHVEAVRSRLRVPSVLVAGAEFWSAFFFASTLAIPVCFYATGWVPEPGSLVLSLGGVLIAVLSVAAFAACQARAEADSYGAW